MKMVAHHAISMNLPIGLLAALPERLYPPVPIRVVFEYRLPPISPVHHMIDRTRILHPQFARHAAYPCRGSGGESSHNSTIAGTDTFSRFEPCQIAAVSADNSRAHAERDACIK